MTPEQLMALTRQTLKGREAVEAATLAEAAAKENLEAAKEALVAVRNEALEVLKKDLDDAIDKVAELATKFDIPLPPYESLAPAIEYLVLGVAEMPAQKDSGMSMEDPCPT